MQSRPKLPPHFINCGGLKTLKPSQNPIKQGTSSSTFCEMWRIFRGRFHTSQTSQIFQNSQTFQPPKPPKPVFVPFKCEASGDVSRSFLLGSELIPQTFYTLYTVNPTPTPHAAEIPPHFIKCGRISAALSSPTFHELWV